MGVHRGVFNTQGAANIPLVIVMIVIATAFLVVLLVFGKKFLSIFCKANNLNRASQSDSNNELPRARTRRPPPASATAPRPPPTALRSEASVLLPDEQDSSASLARPPSTPPTAPPSYEDVIKDNPGILSRGVPMAPPPYSESLTMTQV